MKITVDAFECFPHVREFAKCLIFVHTFNFHSDLIRLFPLFSPFLSFLILDKETEVQDDEVICPHDTAR